MKTLYLIGGTMGVGKTAASQRSVKDECLYGNFIRKRRIIRLQNRNRQSKRKKR